MCLVCRFMPTFVCRNETCKSMDEQIIKRINELGSRPEPFLFVVNYQGDGAFIRQLADIRPTECLYDFEGCTNVDASAIPDLPASIRWEVAPPSRAAYARSLEVVRRNILAGNSYLANLTCQVPVRTNLALRDIFLHSMGRYRLLLDVPSAGIGPLVCFSPETFVRIGGGRISSFPMKGTIDASLPDARERLMADAKEAAEHATIVDLIRNDLSRVATDVRVGRYRYVDVLHTNHGNILQTSSEVSGRLPADYRHHLGDILAAQLPAGSITGAPKDKTCQIIREAETHERGFYTGIMGVCEDGTLNSAVMIRYIEQTPSGLVFKAGGGITAKSQCQREYEEVLQKVYLPIAPSVPPHDTSLCLEPTSATAMNPKFVETIKVLDGQPFNLPCHQARMERTIRHFFAAMPVPRLDDLLSAAPSAGLQKARVVYGGQGVEDVQFAPYTLRSLNTLKVVCDDTIDYAFKITDRTALARLAAQKGDCDDIIIVKHGLVTDTSFTNIALFDGHRWLTPKHPLLLGTQRALLLEQGILHEADISVPKLLGCQKLSLINAMMGLDECVVPVQNIIL